MWFGNWRLLLFSTMWFFCFHIYLGDRSKRSEVNERLFLQKDTCVGF